MATRVTARVVAHLAVFVVAFVVACALLRATGWAGSTFREARATSVNPAKVEAGIDVEGFRSGSDETASHWLKEGIRALGRVPSLRLPTGETRSNGAVIEVEYVAVEDSVVWRNTLRSRSDGLLVDLDVDTVSDLVVNERHPYAHYLVNFDNMLLKLKTAGRAQAVLAFAGLTPRDYEARAFDSVDENRASVSRRVYTLTPGFVDDKVAARAAYDMLFAVSTLRACFVNGEAMDAILAALTNHAELVKRNDTALEKLRAQTQGDIETAKTELQGEFRTEKQKMAGELSSTIANASDLQRERDEASQRRVGAMGTLEATAGLSLARKQALARSTSEIARTESNLENVMVNRGDTTVALDLVKSRHGDMVETARQQDIAAHKQSREFATNEARAAASTERSRSQIRSDTVRLQRERDRVKKLQDGKARNVVAAESAQASLDKMRGSKDDLRRDIASARSQLSNTSTKRGELAGDINRTLKSTRDYKAQMDKRLADAMDANNDAQQSYALWDKFSSLARLEDELDKYDDGLPPVS